MSIQDGVIGHSTFQNPSIHVPKQRIQSERLLWADVARGWSILLVVLMHSTLGVGDDLNATGWTHAIVAFAKPFRMPDFFLVAGLFAGAAANLPWRRFLDRRVLHFTYLYLLWAAVIIVIKGVAGHASLSEIARVEVTSLYEPYSSLWFIYVLPVMFLIVRWTRNVSPALVLVAAIDLHILASTHADGGLYALSADLTGSFAVDSLSLFTVFFLIGHQFRARIIAFADWCQANITVAMLLLAVWAVGNYATVASGWAERPGAIFVVGLAGGLAIVAISALTAVSAIGSLIAALGQRSLAVYLAFAIPMAATRLVLIKLGFVENVGWLSIVTTGAALGGSLLLAVFVRGTALRFLFERPQWLRMQ